MIRNIIVFDFDGTLVLSPEPVDGKKVWEKKKGNPFPHSGWWSKKESLDLEVFDIPLNKSVFNRYLDSIGDKKNMVFLATGRVIKLKNEVQNVLNKHNLEFQDIFLNSGGDTLRFKMNLFEKLIEQHNPEVFTMYDDRVEHLVEFRKWAKNQSCVVQIFDVNEF